MLNANTNNGHVPDGPAIGTADASHNGAASLTALNGLPIITYDEVQRLRKADEQKPNPYNKIVQTGGQERFLTTQADITIYGGSRGGGKMQPYDAKVCTPFGFRNMGDLKVGSIITDPTTGGMERVIQVHEHGMQDVWRVTFSDGSQCECGAEHLWLVKLTCNISKKRKFNGMGQEGDWRVMTFQQMMRHFDKNKGKKYPSHILIPLTEPVKFTRTIRWEIPTIDPYLLGVILGDGCITETVLANGRFAISSGDKCIIERVKQRTGIEPVYVATKQKSDAFDYMFEARSIERFLKYHRLDGKSSKDKFIPKCFLYDTIENRIELLRGLMDTDGTIDPRGHCSYTTISKALANDVAFLVRSLGGTATITVNEAGYKKDGVYIRCNDAFTIYIRFKDTANIFSLERKRARSKPFNGGCCDVNHRMVAYEYVEKKQCRCITVDSPSNLYVTDSFIVTHNSYGILMDALNDVYNPNFHALIMRNEKSDLDAIIETSYQLFKQFGDYNRSKDDMTWNFHAGGFLRFGYYADDIKDFKVRWQGKDFSYIAIDEITHMPYNKFKYIITDNRNAFFIRNRVYGTCNPDPESWVARFIDWWIDEDGYPIPERNGRMRYCFMDGDDPASITWGDTRQEVYDKCRGIIDRYWREDMAQYGDPKDLFIKSVCFIEGKVTENRQLMRSDPTYLANLANQDEAQRARDLDGNWKYREVGTALLKLADMERWFDNPRQSDDEKPYASCDVALDGGDNLVLCLWVGGRRHLKEIFTCRLNSVQAPITVAAKLKEWGVPQQNFTYDLSGLGQLFKGHFPNAVPFTNQGNIDPSEKYVYNDFKSKAAFLFCQAVKNGEFSIEPYLLEQKFSGNGYSGRTLREVLINEKNALRRDDSRTDHGFTLPKKAVMKKLVGHSPDFIEAMLMVMIFDIKKKKIRKGLGYL